MGFEKATWGCVASTQACVAHLSTLALPVAFQRFQRFEAEELRPAFQNLPVVVHQFARDGDYGLSAKYPASALDTANRLDMSPIGAIFNGPIEAAPGRPLMR